MWVLYLPIFLLQLGHAAVIQVSTVTGALQSIRSAISLSNPGDVIEIAPGLYTGTQSCDLLVAISNVTIKGTGGSSRTVIDCGSKSRCISIFGSNVSIIGIQFRNGIAPIFSVPQTVRSDNGRARANLPLPTRRRRKKDGFIPIMVIKVSVSSHGEINQHIKFKNNWTTSTSRKKKPSTTKKTWDVAEDKVRGYSLPSSTDVGGCIFTGPNSISSFFDVKATGCMAIHGSGMGSILSSVTMQQVDLSNNVIILDSTMRNTPLHGAGGYFARSNVSIVNGTFSNNVMTATDAAIGGGLYFYYCDVVSMQGPLVSSNNTLTALSPNTPVKGGAFMFEYSTNPVTMVGPVLVSDIRAYYSDKGWLNSLGIVFYHSAAIITGPMTIINSNSYAPAGAVFGGGLYIEDGPNSIVNGPILIQNMSLFVKTATYMFGAGIYVERCDNSKFIGPITIDSNLLVSSDSGQLYGAGMVIFDSANVVMKGPITISNNLAKTLTVSVTAESLQQVYVPPPRTNASKHCQDSTTVTQAQGTINDGSYLGYSIGIECRWLLSPPVIIQATRVFSITFTSFSTEKGYDFVYIYDGVSSVSPLIGQYSGSLPDVQCSSGACPSMANPIVSAAGTVFIRFTSDDIVTSRGFSFSWTTIDANRTMGMAGVTMKTPTDYNAFSVGGGMALSFSSLFAQGLILTGNKVSNPFLAAGGGIYTQTKVCYLELVDCVFKDNSATGVTGGGGAISAWTLSKISVRNSIFDSNSAVGTGDVCLYFWSIEGSICPASFGGALLTTSGALLNTTQCTFQNNFAHCRSNIDCTEHGGAMATIGKGSTSFMQSDKCIASQLPCGGDPRPSLAYISCQWAIGGCLYLDSSDVTVYNTTFQDNHVSGIGSGGGISTSGTAHLKLLNSLLISNGALLGGGICLTDESVAEVNGTTFLSNFADSAAGALAIRDYASIYMRNTTYNNNTAPRASMVLSYSSDYTSEYSLDHISVITNPGSVTLMLGKIYLDVNTTVYNCTWPGTVFSQDFTSEFLSLTCTPCGEGTYAVDYASTLHLDRSCLPCPYGATCHGASAESNGLMAMGGFWGSADENGIVTFYPCPSGYCCSLSNTQGCEYNHCQGFRTGLLCGTCLPGYGLRFFTESCGSDEICNDGSWAMILVFLGAGVFAAFLVITTCKQSSGLLTVILYFYQVLPMAKSSPWRYAASNVILAIQSIFAMSPSVGDSENDSGVCISAAMTMSQKVGARMILQFLIFFMLILLFFCHWGLHILMPDRIHRKPKFSHYFAASVRFITIAYTTMAVAALQMLQCVWIDGNQVWWFDGTVQCIQSWQVSGIIVASVLFPFPLGVLFLMKSDRWKREDMLSSKWKKETWKVLSNAFRKECRWWLSVSLYRRFLLAMAFTMITDSNWKALATSTLCVLFLVLNFIFVPYAAQITQKAETASLTILAVLALSSEPQVAEVRFAAKMPMSQREALEWFQFVLALSPIVAYLGFVVVKFVFERRISRMMMMDKMRPAAADEEFRIEMEQLPNGKIWTEDESMESFQQCTCSQSGWEAIGCAKHQFC